MSELTIIWRHLSSGKHLDNPHPNTFKNANRKFIKPMGVTGAITKHNSIKTDAAVEKSQRKMLGKLNKLQAKLAAQGIDYKLKDEVSISLF